MLTADCFILELDVGQHVFQLCLFRAFYHLIGWCKSQLECKGFRASLVNRKHCGQLGSDGRD